MYDDGGLSSGEGQEETNEVHSPTDPDCYSWCIMNLGIVQMLQRVLRNTITLTGMEILGKILLIHRKMLLDIRCIIILMFNINFLPFL